MEYRPGSHWPGAGDTARCKRAKTTHGEAGGVAGETTRAHRRGSPAALRGRGGKGCRAGRHWPGAGDTARFQRANTSKGRPAAWEAKQRERHWRVPGSPVSLGGEGGGWRAPYQEEKHASSQTHPPVVTAPRVRGADARDVEVRSRRAAGPHVYRCGAQARANYSASSKKPQVIVAV